MHFPSKLIQELSDSDLLYQDERSQSVRDYLLLHLNQQDFVERKQISEATRTDPSTSTSPMFALGFSFE